MSTPDETPPKSPHPTARGREYLQLVRPSAMGHLLTFFKEAGQHMEPKTRFLISVLKQVVQGSDKGLRQYIRRAMDEGASRDEIIDVILLSYPLANLTRMSEAVNVLLDMELPPEQAGPEWRPVAGVAPPAEGACAHVSLGGHEILVARRGGKLFGLNDLCPHRGGKLHTGTFADGVVTCPLHGWSFRIEDGTSAGRGLGQAATIPVREIDGKLEVMI